MGAENKIKWKVTNMGQYTIGLVAAGVLAASIFGNWFLFKDNNAKQDEISSLKIESAITKTTLDYERKQQAQNDQKIAEYKQSLDEIAAQRDSFRRQAQEAMKKDAKFKSWADTELPDFVRNSLGHKPSNGVRSEGNAGNPGNR